MIRFLLGQAHFAGLFGVGVACFAGIASKTGNTYTEKAREVGLAQEKTNNSQDLLASQNFVNTLDRPMV